MRENVANIHLASIKVDRSNQPIFVASDIENDPIPYSVRGRESGSQFSEVVKLGMLKYFEPSEKRRLAVRMLLPK
jgi:hypothetical protein